MPQRLLGLLLGCLLLVLAVPAVAGAASPSTVTLRVEGVGDTLVPRTSVTTTTAAVVKDGDPSHSCTGTSAAGALEVGTAGQWTGTWYSGLGYGVDSVKGESHVYPDTRYWAFWINNRYSPTGLCDTELQQGDSILFFPDRCDDYDSATQSCRDALLPTSLTAPSSAEKGAAFTVHVDRYDATGKASPLAGATVAGGGATATTDASGNATLALGATGSFELKASKDGFVRSEGRSVCVHEGSDGTCGTTRPGDPPPTSADAPAADGCTTAGDDGLCGTADRRPSLGRITFAKEGQRFARGRGPRTLAGTASPDPSGIRSVRLRLTWSDGRGHCSTYDGTRERLVKPQRCGAANGRWFSAGDRQDWSYLLPAKLGTGRWVIDVRVTDGAGNVDSTLQRGRNRVVFRVA
jgi:hypothetical protein